VCGVFDPFMEGRSIISSFGGLFVVVVVLGKGCGHVGVIFEGQKREYYHGWYNCIWIVKT
jgi:hypothetical protein